VRHGEDKVARADAAAAQCELDPAADADCVRDADEIRECSPSR
jgi:hypothetical protein